MATHVMAGIAEREETCGYCHREPHVPCTCAPGVHLCRICLAAHHGHIPYTDAASVIPGKAGFTGATVILDGAA